MKSFSEYIKEAYNFRLGGSQQKGFEQTKKKTFDELEKGDNIYRCHIDFDELKYAEICTFERIDRLKNNEFTIHYKKKNDPRSDNFMKFGMEELDKTISIKRYDYKNHSSIHIISTNEEDLLSKIYELVKENDPKIINNTINVTNEAYSFRLGGSQQKGFDQTKIKKFGELEKGDIFYWYSCLNGRRNIRKLRLFDDITFRDRTELKYSEEHSCSMPYNLKNFSVFSFSTFYGEWCAATNEEEFIAEVFEKFKYKIDPKKIEDFSNENI